MPQAKVKMRKGTVKFVHLTTSEYNLVIYEEDGTEKQGFAGKGEKLQPGTECRVVNETYQDKKREKVYA